MLVAALVCWFRDHAWGRVGVSQGDGVVVGGFGRAVACDKQNTKSPRSEGAAARKELNSNLNQHKFVYRTPPELQQCGLPSAAFQFTGTNASSTAGMTVPPLPTTQNRRPPRLRRQTTRHPELLT